MGCSAGRRKGEREIGMRPNGRAAVGRPPAETLRLTLPRLELLRPMRTVDTLRALCICGGFWSGELLKFRLTSSPELLVPVTVAAAAAMTSGGAAATFAAVAV